MTTYLSFGSNNIQVYAYEGFDYTIVNPYGFASLSNSSGLDPQTSYFQVDEDGNTQFAVTDTKSTLVASTRTERFVITATNGSNSVNTVTIGPGRFLDASGVTLSNNSYTFYKNEAIRNTLGKPLRLVAPSFELKQPSSIPALPPGLSFVKVASNIYDISGIPLVAVPNSNYQIIGVQNGGSKVITTKFNMIVSNERVQVNTVNPIITNMQIDTPITPCVITSIPPIGTSLLRYSFPTFPDGITAKDYLGNPVTSPFQPLDASYTLVVSGTPTSNAAYSFKNANATSQGFPYTVTSSRTVPLPVVESNTTLQIAFGETVLFDQSSIPPLYVGVPLDSNAIFVRAQTYFDTCNNIANISTSGLPTGLSLLYTPGSDRAYLSGTPSNVGLANYTFIATNSNGKTRNYTVPISVAQDTVSFVSPTPAQDVCYNFILSRPLTSFLPGYYSSNIQFVAQAASRLPVILSAPALSGTGLALDSNGVITGIPSAVTPLSDLTVTATVSGSPATTSRNVKFAILNDQFRFADVCANYFNFVQNVEIAPFQIPVSTLSGRNVIDFGQSNLPSGLSISPAGVVSGTPTQTSPTSGTFTVNPTTGYASGTRDFSYNLIPDSILFTVPQDTYSFVAGESISNPIQVTGTSYSGTAVRNFTMTLPPSYGLSMSSGGLLGGTWTNSIPPNQVLPSDLSFSVTAQAGSLSGTLPVSFTASPILQNASFVYTVDNGRLYSYNDVSWNQVTLPSISNTFDIVIRGSNVDGNFILGTAGSRLLWSTNATNFTLRDLSGTGTIGSKLAFKPGSTTWWVSGQSEYSAVARADLKQSDDNGLTWYPKSLLQDSSSGLYLLTRNSNTTGGGNPYLNGGVSLGYKDGVLMAGGVYDETSSPVMLRSTDDGATWSTVTGFAKESAYFNFDNSSIWIATGSSRYKTASAATIPSPSYFTTSTNTIKYSTDKGLTWSNSSGDFNMFAYEIIYASNTWLATGVNVTNAAGQNRFIPELRYSSNGTSWTKIDLSTNALFDPSNTAPSNAVAPLRLGSMNYDGSNWNVFVQRNTGSGWVTEIYSSPTVTGTWTARDVTDQFSSSGSNFRFLSYTRPQWLRTSNSRVIDILMTFSTGIGNGPQITSPDSSLLLYQYVPVSIRVTSDDPNALFFISDERLPPGLQFDPTTNLITGKPAQQGYFSTPVYAKNNAGVTLKNVFFTINIPRIIRKQDGAGAYTSLLKQYTEVLGAQNARDSRVLPSQERRLGEFMAPVPGDVVTAPFSTTKCKFCGKVDCPTTNEKADGGGAGVAVCNVIDANTGDFIDAGNAESNVCD